MVLPFGRELPQVVLDQVICVFESVRLEGWLANEHREEDDSQGPNVYLRLVALSPVYHFGSYVVWRATDREPLLAFVVELARETKVAYFDGHVFIDEQVAELQIAVHYPPPVDELQALADLSHVALGLQLV